MSMSDPDALLSAITANPDEDTPRLVYADWLDEHGEAERAEFIRVQCKLEHLPRTSDEGKLLAEREKHLQAKLFRHLVKLGNRTLKYRRGFVDTIRSRLETLPKKLAKICPQDAPAFALQIFHGQDDDAVYSDGPAMPVFRDPTLRRCVSLDLPTMCIEGSQVVLRSEHLVNLRRLNFPDNEAGPGIELVASPTFANLRWANFNNSDSANDNPSIIPLAECPHLANLEHLDFGDCEQPSESALAVANAKYWNRLRYLNLSGCWFEPDSAIAIFNSKQLPALTELDLSWNYSPVPDGDSRTWGDILVSEVVKSPLLPRLSKLWLRRTDLTDQGAKELLAVPLEVMFTRLDLSLNNLGKASMAALRERFGPGVCLYEKSEEPT
jgi:uncharacterized protein (TIGR02996 family)